MNPESILRRVLLVDDHPLVRDGMRVALQHHFPGIQIAEAGNAQAALAELELCPVLLAILDVNLPGTNGLDLARQIRGIDRAIKIWMVAAATDPWTVSEAVELGASGFVSKASSSAILPEAIRAVLDGGMFFCAEAQAALRRAESRHGRELEPPGPTVLSEREREVLGYITSGENTKAIADLLQISPKTVETHRQHITRKLGTSNVAALVRYAVRHGLTTV